MSHEKLHQELANKQTIFKKEDRLDTFAHFTKLLQLKYQYISMVLLPQ